MSLLNEENIGKTCTWTSGANGVAKTKTGTILAVCPKGTALKPILEKLGIKGIAATSNLTNVSELDRYLVIVVPVGQGGRKLSNKYYTPNAKYVKVEP